MDYSKEFLGAMATIERIAKKYGFDNCSQWADSAYKTGEITAQQSSVYRDVRKLRNQFVNGKAQCVGISFEAYQQALLFKQAIEKSLIRG